MIRLGLLTLATLVGLLVVMALMGGDDLRADRTPRTAAPSAAQDAGAPAIEPPAAPLPAEPPTEIVPVARQTPERISRFPGPPLEPSPEYADGTPESAAPMGEGGPVLYVTADRVNMRSGPGTGNPVVTGLDGGTAVEATGPLDADWIAIRTPSGQQGYVSGQFLSPDTP